MSNDMLVKLYELPDLYPVMEKMKQQDIVIRRPQTWERRKAGAWIDKYFPGRWNLEFDAAFRSFPVTAFLAEKDDEMLGFVCYDCVAKNFFGPMGVHEKTRGTGIGRALTLTALHAMKADGYGYAIIGWAGPQDFYQRCCGAVPIPDSRPGIYSGDIKDPAGT